MVQSYTDRSNLYRLYGPDKATPTKVGEYCTTGSLREIRARIDLTTLGTARSIIGDVTLVPKMRIEEIEIVVLTAATSSGSGTLNIGVVREDRTTTYDDDGFVAALALTALDAAGEKTVIRVGSTSAGALLGTTLANPGLLCADYDTGAYQTGVIEVSIRYMAV